MFNVLTVSWGSVTVILVGLLIYRALIGMREEDQLFLATGEEHQVLLSGNGGGFRRRPLFEWSHGTADSITGLPRRL